MSRDLVDYVADAICTTRYSVPLTSINITGNQRKALRDEAKASLQAVDDAGYAIYHKGACVTAR